MSLPDFHNAFQKTISFEGGYVNDPDDRGGETYKGISRLNWPDWEGWKIIDLYKKHKPGNLNHSLAGNTGLQNLVSDFYLEHYWMPLNLDAFHSPVADELFDTAVNQGKNAAAKYLQETLNKLNRNQKDYPDITVDGKIGRQTLSAYKKLLATQRFASRNQEKIIKWIVRWLNYFQLKKYDLITYRDPAQEKFIPGWTERV